MRKRSFDAAVAGSNGLGQRDELATAISNPVVDFRQHPPEFSLVLGGPLYQLMRRAHISNDALGLARRRIISITLFCWLPLALLSAWQGQLWTGSAVPFLMDAEVQARFLVAVPLLVGAELVVHQRMRFLVAQFLERDLIAEKDMQRLQATITSALALRNSTTAELLIVLLVYGVGVLMISPSRFALETDAWLSTQSGGAWSRSLAGIWFIYVSLPMFHVLLLRWYFRVFVWARFLWQVSRIPLCLVPTHPDHAAGLGFLSNAVYAYIPLLVAHGTLLSGYFSSRIFYAGESLVDFKIEVLVFTLFLLCLVQAPLLVFSPQLAQAKRTGHREYGALASRYVRAFDETWLLRHGPASGPLLGSADVQSLADLDGAYGVVRSMRTVLISRQAIVTFVVAIVAPIVPLALTIMPWEQFLIKLFGILF